MSSHYEFYNCYGSGYYNRFIKRNPEFDTPDFLNYVTTYNRGDRDSGEIADIAKHEVLRLAAAWAEDKWRFPNVYGEGFEQ